MFDGNIMLCSPSASPDSFRGGKAAKSSDSAGHALVGPGLGDAYPGVVEVPEDDQNDVGRGDVGQDAAVPAQEVQCGGHMYVVALGVCNVADSSSIFQTFLSTACGFVVACMCGACSSRMPPVPLMISSSASRNPSPKIRKSVLDMVQTDNAGDSASDAAVRAG